MCYFFVLIVVVILSGHLNAQSKNLNKNLQKKETGKARRLIV
jgi:hypothetical protein